MPDFKCALRYNQFDDCIGVVSPTLPHASYQPR